MRRLKNIVAGAIIAVGLLGLVKSSAFAIPVVSIDPLMQTVNIDNKEKVEFSVIAQNNLGGGILSFGFDIIKPNSWIYDSHEIGDGSGNFNDVSVPDYIGGLSTVSGGVAGNEVTLASLSYTPTRIGFFTFYIEGNAQQTNEGLWILNNFNLVISSISAPPAGACVKDNNNSCFEVQGGSTAVPEPSTISLIGFGLLTLAGVGYSYTRRTRRNIN